MRVGSIGFHKQYPCFIRFWEVVASLLQIKFIFPLNVSTTSPYKLILQRYLMAYRTIDGVSGEVVGALPGSTQYVTGAAGYGAGQTTTTTVTEQYVQPGAVQYTQGVAGGVVGGVATGAGYGTTTTTSVVPGTQTTHYKTEYVYEPGTTTYNVVQPATTTYNVVQPATTQVVTSGAEIIKGESRIEYIPFEQTVTDYEERQYVERVPRQRTITEYEERRYVETVPREVAKVDYYTIEYLKQYIPQVVPETKVEMVPVERVVTRTEYIPVERKIVHYPQTSLGTEVQTRIDAGLAYGAIGGTHVTRETVVGGPVYGGATTVVGAPVYGGATLGGSVIGGTTYGGALAGSTYATGPAIVGGSSYRTQTVTTGGPVVGGTVYGAPVVGGTTVVGGPVYGGATTLVGGQVLGGQVVGGTVLRRSAVARETYVSGPTYTTTEYTSGPVEQVTTYESYGTPAFGNTVGVPTYIR